MQQPQYDAYGKPIPQAYPSPQAYAQPGTPAYTQPGYAGDSIPPPGGPPPGVYGAPFNVQTQQPGAPFVPGIATGQFRIPYIAPIDEVYPFIGLGFFTLSVYCTWPFCVGCACTNTTLCCSNQQFSCVATEEPNALESACICNRTNCECCHPVKTFTKFQFHMYCIDGRFAIPGSIFPQCADPDHPMIINLLGLTCFYCDPQTPCSTVMACFQNVAAIKATALAKASGV